MNTVEKLFALLPSTWFSDAAKKSGGILYAVISSFAKGLEYVEAGADYVKKQTRISTATDTNLENISVDFFSSGLPRRAGEGDSAYSKRILEQIFLEKGTKTGLIKALQSIGATVVESWEPSIDGFFTDYSKTDLNRISDENPYNGILFITRPLAPSQTKLFFTDYNYTDSSFMVDSDAQIWQIQDSDIFKVIEATKTCGTQVYVVLDPIPMTQTAGNNYTSSIRYYVPAITKPVGPLFTLDSSLLDSGDELA